jgi:hypothetical protein
LCFVPVEKERKINEKQCADAIFEVCVVCCGNSGRRINDCTKHNKEEHKKWGKRKKENECKIKKGSCGEWIVKQEERKKLKNSKEVQKTNEWEGGRGKKKERGEK